MIRTTTSIKPFDSLTVLPFTPSFSAVGEGVDAMTMFLVVLIRTNILFAVSPGEGAMAVLITVLPLTYILFAARLPGVGAMPVLFMG